MRIRIGGALLVLLLASVFSYAQPSQKKTDIPLMRQIFHENIDKAQRTLYRADGMDDDNFNVTRDDDLNSQITYYLKNVIDDLQSEMEMNSSLDNNNKIKFLRGVADVLIAYENGYRSKVLKADMLIDLIKAYKEAMQLERFGNSIYPVVAKNELEIGTILIRAFPFQKNPGIKASNDELILKAMKRNPSKVMQILVKNPNVPFADSVIIAVAKRDQEEIYTYAGAGNSFSRKIAAVDDQLVKTIYKMATMKSGRLYFPFLDDIYRGNLSFDTLADAVSENQLENSDKYYRALVRSQIRYSERMLKGDTPMVYHALETRMRQKVRDPYITDINGLHDSPDAIRFKRIENLTPEELYYLAIYGEADIYTSSYLGVYKRIFERMKTPSADTLLQSVKYDHFKKWIKMAAGFNTLDDFLKKMDSANAVTLMQNFVDRLDRTNSLEDAVDVADSYGSISNESLKKLILSQVQLNLNDAKSERGRTIYNLLNTIFQSMDTSSKVDIVSTLGIQPVHYMPAGNLKDTSGRIIIEQYFYGDKDGQNVFGGFVRSFRNNNWKIIDKPEWVEVVSTKGTPITIYANKPLDEDKDLDAKAQQHLNEYLYEKGINPTVVIHRGHSYYVRYTIEQLQPSAKVVLLGSCGGYHNLNDVLKVCPEAHIISSKQVGSGLINGPMISHIAETLRQDKELNWPQMWKSFEATFKDPTRKERFDDYIPPHKNLGAILIIAYNKLEEKQKMMKTSMN